MFPLSVCLLHCADMSNTYISMHGRALIFLLILLFYWFLPGANVPFWHLPTCMLLQIRDIWAPEICAFGPKAIGVNEPPTTDFHRHQIKLGVTEMARASYFRSSAAASNSESFKTFPNTRTWREQSWAWTWSVLYRAVLRYTAGVFMQPTCFGGKGIVLSHVVPVGFSTWKLPATRVDRVAVGQRVTLTGGMIMCHGSSLAEAFISWSYNQCLSNPD